jgi:hypothetical protein
VRRYQWTWAPADPVTDSFGKGGYETVSHRQLIASEFEHEITLLRELVVSGEVTDAETGELIPSFRTTPAIGEPSLRPQAGFPAIAGREGKAPNVVGVNWLEDHRTGENREDMG